MLSRLQLTQVSEPAFDELLIARDAKERGKPSKIGLFRVRLVPRREVAVLEAYDGIYCLCTNVPESKLSAEQAIEAYRKKNVVEEAFRVIKSEVKIRPVRVRAQTRVEGHIIVCALAYLLVTALENALKIKRLTYKNPVSASKRAG